MPLADKKKVVVLIRRSPLNSSKGSEALRQSVGLTLAENEVTVLLLDAAAWLSVPLSPQVVGGGQMAKHIEALLSLKVKVKVEEESLQKYGVVKNKVIKGIATAKRIEIFEDLTSADAVICF